MTRVRKTAVSVTAIALLAAPCAASADVVTFAPTGAEQSVTVPARVTVLHVVAVGGRGGNFGLTPRPGGFGATVSADLPVTPGQLLYVEVAGNGADSGPSAPFGGGGWGMSGGGGASDVRTVSALMPDSLASRLLIAAGGGGAAANARGGAAGEPGCGPAPSLSLCPAGGGGAGTISAGGAGGGPAVPGNPGRLGVGGEGGIGGRGVGGGGGGGLWGGGGGRGEWLDYDAVWFASGGGGGSSWVDPRAANAVIATDATGAPSVTITYDVPAAPQAPPVLEPSNDLTISGVRAGATGAVRLLARVTLQGRLRATAKAVVPRSGRAARVLTYGSTVVTTTRAGTVALRVKPRPSALRLLRKHGRLSLSIRVTFTPPGGAPDTETTHITVRSGRR